MSAQHFRQARALAIAVFFLGILLPPSANAEPSATPGNKTERQPIYDESADGEKLIAEAIRRAKAEGKHVLIEWGGNWCGWCHKLHNVFKNDTLVAPIVTSEYELVLIDCNNNRQLMESFGGKDTRYAFPHLTILDDEGKLLTNQETGSLEVGPKHDPEAVAALLKQWRPEPQNAEELLQAALHRAANQKKRVLLHVGTPTCGWCKVLSRFLVDHESVLSQDFVDLRIDTVRMDKGNDVAERFRPAKSLGVPWMVIVDSSAKVLATSVGPEGNIGYPATASEIEHFMQMLGGTRQRLNDQALKRLRADLDAFRLEREQRLAAGKP